jgi:aminoglycoside 3-N-acetyltransferase I
MDRRAVVRRLQTTDAATARKLFALFADVFETDHSEVSNDYAAKLLARADFWAYVATLDDVVVGGLTAHTLPMTRSESAEIFLYDLAVDPSVQRRGVGRQLVTSLVADAAAAGIEVVFVSADNDDTHALDFYSAIGGRPAEVTIFDLGAE